MTTQRCTNESEKNAVNQNLVQTDFNKCTQTTAVRIQFFIHSCTTKAQHDIQFKNTEREIEKHDYNKLCLGSVVGDIFLLICMS